MKVSVNPRYAYAVHAVLLLLYGVLIYFSYFTLSIINNLTQASVNTIYTEVDSAYLSNLLFVGLSALLANIYYWQSGFVKLFWLCLFYFTLTTIAYFWLLEQLFLFEKSSGLWEGGFSVTIVVAPILILGFSVLLYVNYLIIRFAKNRKTQRA
jgi:hypothetical protein